MQMLPEHSPPSETSFLIRFFVLRNKKRFLRFFSLQFLNKSADTIYLLSAHAEHLCIIFNSNDCKCTKKKKKN